MLIQSTMSEFCELPDDSAQPTHLDAHTSQLDSPSPVNEISTTPSSTSPGPPPRHQISTRAPTNDQCTGVAIARNQVEVRLLVRRREAGALIGKRGANIKRLRETFAKSTFNIPDTGNGPERVVCIAADSLASLEAILADLAQLFLEKSGQLAKFQQQSAVNSRRHHHHHQDQCDQIELKQLINSSHAGLLIGMGGQSIRKLRNDSKAAIKIYEMCCPNSNERVCAIKAKPPVVVSTIKMIQEIIEAAPAALKASVVCKPYDALNYDPILVDKYGGYVPDDLSQVDLMRLVGMSGSGAGGATPNRRAQTRGQPFSASALDMHPNELLSSNSGRPLYSGNESPPGTDHARPQLQMFPGGSTPPTAAHLLSDGLGALLGAFGHRGMLPAHLMRPSAPTLKEFGLRGPHTTSRYHPYLASLFTPPPPPLPLPANCDGVQSKQHLHEHERLLIAHHLQMLSARERHLPGAPTGFGCSCCARHGQHQHSYTNHHHYHSQKQPQPQQQQQQQNQQQSDSPVSSSCSCASTGCEATSVAQNCTNSNQTSGDDRQARKSADKIARPSLPPSTARD